MPVTLTILEAVGEKEKKNKLRKHQSNARAVGTLLLKLRTGTGDVAPW